jgi:preprotein translocase subunit SecB
MLANLAFSSRPGTAEDKKGFRLMANQDDDTKPAAAPSAGNGAAPSLNVLVQYVKDLSFESPGAPNTLRARDKAPGININVNVTANPVGETEFDVQLTLNAKASEGDKVLFNVELVYGGVFRVAGFPQEHVLPILFIECPRLLFPFARQIVADCTRNGGFPPLMIDPIDFAQMFQQRLAQEQAKAQAPTGTA